MNNVMTRVMGLAMGFVAAAGCSGPESSGGESSETAPGVEAAASEAQAVPASDPRLALERSRRAIDRGDGEAAAGELEALAAKLEDGDEKNEVLLELSRAYEIDGDVDAAVDVLESLLIANATRERYEAREPAEKRLRLLLTGSAEETGLRLPAKSNLPPITAALQQVFEPDAEGRVLVDVFIFGLPRSEHSGIFEIAEAKRHELEQDLTTNLKVSQSISSTGSWLGLPRAIGETDPSMPQADRSLLVFYFDLGDNRVPSRYDEYLPLPSEEIAAVLERGEGLVAARKREGGKPVLVIAAPRRAQLELVEQALAEMKEIPYEPAIVEVKPNLTGPEIQSVVRGSRKAMHECYKTALTRDAALTGKMNLKFAIDGAGAVVDASLGEGSSLVEEQLVSCVLGHVAKLSFPATGERTTVTYPISMTP